MQPPSLEEESGAAAGTAGDGQATVVRWSGDSASPHPARLRLAALGL